MVDQKATRRLQRNAKIIKSLNAHAGAQEVSLGFLELCAYVSAYNHTGELAAPKLEHLCLKKALPLPKEISEKPRGILFVVSELHEVGGHSRVTADLMRALEEPSSLFVLRPNSEIPKWIEREVELAHGEIYRGEEETLTTSKKLQDVSLEYRRIILLTNPEDITPLLAYGKRFPRPIYYYNHADHTCCLGYSVAKTVLEITPHGADTTRAYRGIGQTSYFSIPCGLEMHQNWHGSQRVVSMASAYKFETIKELSFRAFVSALLEQNRQITFEVLGVPENHTSWQTLKRHFGSRLILHGLCSKAETKRLLHGAHLFIDSFPIHSYLASLEAVYHGIPVLSLKTEEPTITLFEKSEMYSQEALVQMALEMLTWEEPRIAHYVEAQQTTALKEHSFETIRERFDQITTRYDDYNSLVFREITDDVPTFTLFQESQEAGLFHITKEALGKLGRSEKLFVVRTLLLAGVLLPKVWNYLLNRRNQGK